jgi:hypothetical protein
MADAFVAANPAKFFQEFPPGFQNRELPGSFRSEKPDIPSLLFDTSKCDMYDQPRYPIPHEHPV